MSTSPLNARQAVTKSVRVKDPRRPIITPKAQRAVAKTGMAGSLGTLFVSGFFKFQGAKTLHIYSGFGLLAFTVWHHFLNQPPQRPRRR
jgi:hypothetical protein